MSLLLITGTPRAGTTHFAAYCQMMGQTIDGIWVPGLMPGGLEDNKVKQINKNILKHGRSDEIDKAIQQYPHSVIKEPNFVSVGNTTLIDAWYANHKEMKLLILYRDFGQVGHSLFKTKGIKSIADSPEESTEIIESRFNQFVERIKELGIPYMLLEHPQFISDYPGVYQLLTEFAGLTLTPNSDWIKHYSLNDGSPEEVWNQWFDLSKVKKY